jgi:hypothetical protein
MVGVTAIRAWGTAAREVTALEDGPVLFNLTITFLVVRSFTDKPNGSNSIKHQLSVVKR